MGITLRTRSGEPFRSDCVYCEVEGQLERVQYSNQVWHIMYFCPKCGNSCCTSIGRDILKAAGIDRESLPVHTREREQRPPSVWDDRPDCKKCGNPASPARQGDRLVWACRMCGRNCGPMDERLASLSHILADHVPDYSVVYLKALPYADYLRSEHWRAIRGHMLWLDGFRCRLCKSTNGLEVHLASYERLGEERPEDLITLCDACHRHHHSRIMERPVLLRAGEKVQHQQLGVGVVVGVYISEFSVAFPPPVGLRRFKTSMTEEFNAI